MQIGDIVTLPALRGGRWVFDGLRSTSGPEQAKFLAARDCDQRGAETAFTCGTGNATVIASPSLSLGMTVNYQGEVATVTAEHDGLVTLEYAGEVTVPSRYGARWDQHFEQSSKVDVPRAVVILQNIKLFT